MPRSEESPEECGGGQVGPDENKDDLSWLEFLSALRACSRGGQEGQRQGGTWPCQADLGEKAAKISNRLADQIATRSRGCLSCCHNPPRPLIGQSVSCPYRDFCKTWPPHYRPSPLWVFCDVLRTESPSRRMCVGQWDGSRRDVGRRQRRRGIDE